MVSWLPVLLWGLSRGADGAEIQLFFLGCVLVAGLFGAAHELQDPLHSGCAGR